jgi:hypothetical protein
MHRVAPVVKRSCGGTAVVHPETSARRLEPGATDNLQWTKNPRTPHDGS